ncbi:DUF4097 family beta strand repeat-containing protein [Streptomyces sp. NPDC047002]|uniref:DUF4097 family beta strand repeat-containing protein n=1 Tax=Streptomyces sp. NPDC047002 TaxID=3155475 RepID=UPI00345737F1
MRRQRGTGVVLGALCAALAAGAAGCGPGGVGGGGAWPDGSSPAASAAPGKAVDRLAVTTPGGVRLRPAPDGRTRVSGRVEARWSHHGGAWVLTLACRDGGPCDRTPTVEVPPGARVTVSARDAGIDAAGLTGALRLTTVNGDVTVADLGAAGAPVSLATRNGSVRATGLAASSLAASSVNGDVDLDCAHAPASVDAATTNGSVRLTVPRGAPPYTVGAATGSGQRRIAVPTRQGGPVTLALRTVNGDVTAREGP